MLDKSRKVLWIIIILVIAGVIISRRLRKETDRIELTGQLMESIMPANFLKLEFTNIFKNPNKEIDADYLSIIYSNDSLLEIKEIRELIDFNRAKIIEMTNVVDSIIVMNNIFYIGKDGKSYKPLDKIPMIFYANGKFRFN